MLSRFRDYILRCSVILSEKSKEKKHDAIHAFIGQFTYLQELIKEIKIFVV